MTKLPLPNTLFLFFCSCQHSKPARSRCEVQKIGFQASHAAVPRGAVTLRQLRNRSGVAHMCIMCEGGDAQPRSRFWLSQIFKIHALELVCVYFKAVFLVCASKVHAIHDSD